MSVAMMANILGSTNRDACAQIREMRPCPAEYEKVFHLPGPRSESGDRFSKARHGPSLQLIKIEARKDMSYPCRLHELCEVFYSDEDLPPS